MHIMISFSFHSFCLFILFFLSFSDFLNNFLNKLQIMSLMFFENARITPRRICCKTAINVSVFCKTTTERHRSPTKVISLVKSRSKAREMTNITSSSSPLLGTKFAIYPL